MTSLSVKKTIPLVNAVIKEAMIFTLMTYFVSLLVYNVLTTILMSIGIECVLNREHEVHLYVLFYSNLTF